MQFLQQLQYESDRRRERILRAAWLVSLLGPAVTALAYIWGRRVVLWADLLRRSVELLALLTAWAVFRIVARGTSSRFHYGYGKLEEFSSLFVSGVMLFAAVTITLRAAASLHEPVQTGWILPGLIISTFGVGVNGWFWRRNRHFAAEESTPVFEAQWRLYRAKTVMDASVLITLSGTRLVGGWESHIDLAGSVVLALFLSGSALRLIPSAIFGLLDRAPPEVEKALPQVLATRTPDLGTLKNMRCRRTGGRLYIELFIEFEADLPLKEVEERSRRIRAAVREAFAHSEVTVIPLPNSPSQ